MHRVQILADLPSASQTDHERTPRRDLQGFLFCYFHEQTSKWLSRPTEFHHRAESARGLHPEPLTDSGRKPLDLSGSCHPLKAAAFHRDRRVPPVSPLTLFDRDAGDLLPSL